MKYSKFVISALSGLVLSTALYQPALAQRGAYYSDGSLWQVSDVSADTGAGYCVLSRSYGRDVVINIARNLDRESSLSFHFLTGDVDFSAVKTVVFDPGAGESRSAEVTPLDDGAFVAKVGNDGAFFGALEDTGFLRLAVGSQSYSFDVGDFDKGQSQLGACLTSLPGSALVEREVSEVSAVKPRPAEAAPVAPAFDSGQEKELELLKSHVSLLERENVGLRQQIDVFDDRLGEQSVADNTATAKLKDELRALKAENENLKSEGSLAGDLLKTAKDGLVGQISSLEEDNLRLSGLLDTASKTTAAQLTANSELSDKSAAMKADNAELLSELEALKAAYEDIQLEKNDVVSELSVLRESQVALKADLKDINAAKQSLETYLNAEKSQNSLLTTQLAAMTSDLKIAAEAIEVAEAKEDQLMSDIKAFEAAGSSKSEANAKLLKENAEYQAQLAAMMADLKTATEIIEVAEAKEDQLMSDIKAFEAAGSSKSEANAKLLKENAEYQAQLAAMTSDLKVAAEAIEVAEAKEDQLMSDIKAFEAAGSSKSEANAKLLKENAEYQAQLAAMMADLKTATKIIEVAEVKENQLMSDIKAFETAGLSKSEANAALEKRTQDLEELKLSVEATNADLLKENAEYEAQLATMMADLKAAGLSKSETTAALEAQLSDLERDNQRAEKDVIALRAKNAAYEAEIAEVSAVLAQATNANEGEAVAYASLERKVSDLEASYKQSQDDNEELRDVNRTYEAKLAEMSDTLRRASSSQDVLLGRLETAEGVQQDLRAKNSSLEKSAAKVSKPPVVATVAKASSAGAKSVAAVAEKTVEAVSEVVSVPVSSAFEPTVVADSGGAAYYVNEAQRFESEVSQGINAPSPVTKPLASETADDLAAARSPLLEHLAALESAPPLPENPERGGDIVAPVPVAAIEEPVEEIVEVVSPVQVAVQEAVEPVIDVAEAHIEKETLPVVDAVSEAEIFEADIVRAEIPQAAPAPVSPAFVETVLADAGVSLSQSVQRVDAPAIPSGVTVHQWRVGDIYGSAEEQRLGDERGFDDKVEAYLINTEARCGGDFAVIPSDTSDVGDVRVDSYDIACLGGDIDATASLLFFHQGGVFSVVAHEAAAEKMDAAMEIRDRLAFSLARRS